MTLIERLRDQANQITQVVEGTQKNVENSTTDLVKLLQEAADEIEVAAGIHELDFDTNKTLLAEIEQLKGQRRDGFTAASDAQRDVSNLQMTVEQDAIYMRQMEAANARLRRERDEVRRYERDNHHNALMCPYCTPDPVEREQPWFKSNPRTPQEAESEFFLVPSGMNLRYAPQYAIWQGDSISEAIRVRDDRRSLGQKLKLYDRDGAQVTKNQEELS